MDPSSDRKKLVLIAEDDASLRSLFHQALERDGYAVRSVENGRALVELVHEVLGDEGGAVDLIVSDIRMPELDGLAALTRLRDENVAIPAVLMTAFGDSITAKAAARLDASLLSKPIGLRRLREVVQERLAAPA